MNNEQRKNGVKLGTCERESKAFEREASQRTKLGRREGNGGEGGKLTKVGNKKLRVKKHTAGLLRG